MKKLFLTIIFCLFASVGYAADFWVYIRTYDKPELVVGGAGRSKKGDIVQVLACQATNDKGVVFNRVPSEKEQKEWLILKVSDIPEDKIRLAMESWQEQTGVTTDGQPIYTTRAYRKYKIPDLDKLKSVLKITVDTGIVPITFINNKLVIEEKTVLDLAKYEQDTKTYLATQKIKKPFEYVLRLLLPFAYAAELGPWSVITDGGGNYLTLALAEDGIDGTVADPGDTATINCSGTTADTTAVTFAGWDADVTVVVNGDYAVTSGIHYSANYYRRETGNVELNLDIQFGNTIINNVQFKCTRNNYQSTAVNIANTLPTSSTITVNRCIMQGVFTGTEKTDPHNGIYMRDVDSTLTVKNCVIYGWYMGGTAVNLGGITNNYGTSYIYNTTIYGCYSGIRRNNGTITATNNAIFGNIDDINGTVTLTYSAGDDADFDAGTGNIGWDDQSTTWDDHFPNYATYDFHLASTSSLINAGTDLFGSGVTTDIDGDTLSVRNDIGADEYVAAGGARRRIFID